ncbi:MAG: ABC transporter ATP-binding protein [Sphingobacteriaceae bacterium]|nr:ABC transporter ATP-binding protein [Sphingobacteriaceae bacterium]
MEPIINLKGLEKNYGTHKAVDGLNLDIYPGEIFGLLGPNGAGKTTTILMMLGLTEPDNGTATVCGYNATRNPIAVKQKVGYMPDNVGFYPQLSALENLLYIGRLNGLGEQGIAAHALAVLDIVGLKDAAHKRTSSYSRGMKQRLGLAEVLIKNPEVIILDEPTLGIDPTGVREFLELIKSLREEQGLTVLLSSHHLHHVQQVCDRVGIFVNGKLLAQGNQATLTEELFGNAGIQTVIQLTQAPADATALREEFSQWPGITTLSISGDLLTFSSKENITPRLIRILIERGEDILRVTQKEYGLDEIYQKYFESSPNKTTDHERSIRNNLFGRGKRK